MQACVIRDVSVFQCYPGCIMAPCNFVIYLSYLLYHALQANMLGVYLHTRFNYMFFNVQHFLARKKELNTSITDLLFYGDAAMVTHTCTDLQALLDCFAAAYTAFWA